MKKRVVCLVLMLAVWLGAYPAWGAEEPLRFWEGPELSALMTLNGAVVSGPLAGEEISGNLAYVDDGDGAALPALRFYPNVSDERVKDRVADRARFPEGTGFSDVGVHDWFAPYVNLCVEHGLMKGTDKGFEPYKTLTIGECTAIAARLREGLTGEAIPVMEDVPWYLPYAEYIRGVEPALTGLTAHAEDNSTRYEFLRLLNAALLGQEGMLGAINAVEMLPDPGFQEDEMVLGFYNAGILTGTDQYGTFAPDRTLTRAEAAAMVARVVEPELRLSFVPEDYSPFVAAGMEPGTVMFEDGTTAEEFLGWVNGRIAMAEESAVKVGEEFNWHSIVGGTEKSTLEWVRDQVLEDLGVTEGQGTQAYRDFDYQVYYSRLIDVMGETLEPKYGVGTGAS